MKKALSLILAFLLCLSLSACQDTEDQHVHQWKAATCTGPKTCKLCGDTEGDPKGHNWLDSTSGSGKICIVCGATDDSTAESTSPSEPNDFSGITVSIASIASDSQDELWFFKQIEEKFGCEVEVIEFAQNQVYEEAMAVRLAENNLPTIFMSFLPIDQIIELGEQGKFVDVMAPENLEKMPNFAKIFVENEDVFEEYMMSAAEDNSHYILPVYEIDRRVNHYWVYEEKAFEKAGVEWAGDPEGFLDMLRKLKAYYPDSYPMTGGAWNGICDRTIFTWGINGSYAAFDWDKKEWFYGATTDAYYDMLDMFQTAYNESLMHPDTLSMGSGSIQSHITSGQSFLYNSWLGWMTAHNDAFIAEEWDMHEVPAPTPVGPNGKTLEVKKFENNAGTIISNQDPEAAACAMAIMNWMYDADDYQGAWCATVGPDECWTTGDDGNKYWNYESNLHTDIGLPPYLYGMFNSSLCVIYHKESPYYSFNAEEQMAQDIGDEVGYFRAPPVLPSMDSETAKTYAAAQKEIQNMQVKFIVENWNRAKYDAWAKQFNETYGRVMDYLNS